MSNFTIHSIDSAPQKSKALLAGAQGKLGFIPNLFGVMAEAPAVLEAYLSLSSLLERTSLTAEETEVVNLSVSAVNGCDYCLAAHTTIASLKKVNPEIANAAAAGEGLADPKLDALARLTRNVVKTRGWPEADALNAFYDAGYTNTQYLEVILGVTMKTLSNYVNHQAETQIDQAFGGSSKAA